MTPPKWLLLQLAVFFLSQTLMAATHYVWCGASGTGTGANFTNAYSNLPASMTRGDTYVVAGSGTCTYGSGAGHNFNDAESGTTVITVRHASSTLDSGVTGYQATFASTQAKWTVGSTTQDWIFRTGYYLMDGNPDTQSGGGIGNANCTSSCGFLLQDNTDLKPAGFILITCSSGSCTHITIKGTEIDNSGVAASGGVCTSGIDTDASVGSHWDNLTLSYDYIHDIPGGPIDLTKSADGFTFTRGALVNMNTGSQCHGEMFDITSQTNFNISYSLIQNCSSTGCIVLQNAGTSTGNVFGNVFNNTDPTTYHPGNGILACINSVSCTASFFNNTIIGFTDVAGGTARIDFSGGASGSSVTSYNNLWYGNSSVNPFICSGCTLTTDYNCYESTTDSSNPTEKHACVGSTNYFVNVSSRNFHLASETPSSPNGFNTNSLLSASTLDPDGMNRSTADGGTWSRGAYADPSQTGQPPTGLTAAVH
jgi:hypothetical protein